MRLVIKLFPFVFLLILGIIVYWTTFKLDIFGDSWLVFWNGKQNFGSIWPWNLWTTYFNPYGVIHLLMYVYMRLAGFNSTGLYLVSFAFRLISGCTFYIFLRHRSFKPLISLVGASLFLITPIGLETTDWAFQFASFISLTLFFISIDLLLRLDTNRKIILFLLTFFLTVIINPIRGHGILLSIWALTVSQLIMPGTKTLKLRLTGVLVASLLIFLMLGRWQTFGDTRATYQSLIKPGLTMLTTTLGNGNYQYLTTLFANMGNEFAPDQIIHKVLDFNVTTKIAGGYRAGLEIVLMSSVFCSFLALSRKRPAMFWIFLIQIAVGYLVHKLLFYQVSASLRISAVLGVEALIFMVVTLFFDGLAKNKDAVSLDVLVLAVTGGFLLIPWIHDPANILYSINRYLIFAAFIVPLIVCQILESNWPRLIKIVPLIMISVMYLTVTNYEISQMYYRHGYDYTQAVWKNLDPYLKDLDYNHRQYIIYFTSNEPARLHDSVVYVFNFRAGLLYNVNKLDNLPMPIDNLADFRSLLTDGEASRRYFGKDIVFSEDNARAFEIIDGKVSPLSLDSLRQ